jgi:RecA/RadA recombinase
MSYFRDLVKSLKDENTSFAADGISSGQFSGSVNTGSHIFNALLSGDLFGGMPNNKILALAGESSTGKTFFALGILKQFLKDHPTGAVFYFDTEAAVTKDMINERGIDGERVIISEPDSVQSFRHSALKILESYGKTPIDERPPMMMVLDSLGQLSTTKELEDTLDGKETRDMTRAQVLKAAFRVLTLKLARLNVPMIVTNHVYDSVGGMFPTKAMSGGSGLRYCASQIIFLSKRKDKDGTEVIGNIIRCKTDKSRFTKENKQVEIKLSFDSGLDQYYGLLELAEKYGIFKKVSTRYELPDGTKVFGKSINNNPKKYYTDEIMTKLNEAAKKEFTYGSSWADEENEDEDEDEEENEAEAELLQEQINVS